jgi:hypothetical protein
MKGLHRPTPITGKTFLKLSYNYSSPILQYEPRTTIVILKENFN